MNKNKAAQSPTVFHPPLTKYPYHTSFLAEREDKRKGRLIACLLFKQFRNGHTKYFSKSGKFNIRYGAELILYP